MSRRDRREFTVAVVLCAVGAAIALWAESRPWAVVVVVRPAPLPEIRRGLTGKSVAPIVGALATVGLAGSVALVATRGFARLAVGLMLVLSGGGSAAFAAAAMINPLHPPGGEVVRDRASITPLLCVIGGILIALAGVATVARGRRWPAMGGRYAAARSTQPSPAIAGGDARVVGGQGTVRPSASLDSLADAWDAMDRGEDPTDGLLQRPPADGPEIPER
jgi:hypothetical protein